MIEGLLMQAFFRILRYNSKDKGYERNVNNIRDG